MNRSRVTAAVMVTFLVVSLMILFIVPAESEDPLDQTLAYASLALYVVALALVAPLIYFRRTGGGTGAPASDGGAVEDEDDFEDESSEIEREFEALEKEIEREEIG